MHQNKTQLFNFSSRRNFRHNQGFSLVELIVVILIIGILAVILVPSVVKYQEQAKENIARNNINQILSSIDIAYAAVGTDIDAQNVGHIYYPTTTSGLVPTYVAALFALYSIFHFTPVFIAIPISKSPSISRF